MDKLCRVCLEGGKLSSIFSKGDNLLLCEMIEYCCNVKINKNDGLPENICSNCVNNLRISYQFKQSCESSDVRLRQQLGLSIPNKVSNAVVMTDPIVMAPTTIVNKCNKSEPLPKKRRSTYIKKPESEKLKRGPKSKPKGDTICKGCNKEFQCQAQLEIHLRTHTADKPFVCKYCPSRFAQMHNLTRHLRVHTGEKPFECEHCSKRFSKQGNLQAHVKIHGGQKDNVCSLCSKSFISSSVLIRHIQKHDGAKNLKCDICPLQFIHQRDLNIHIKRNHQNSDNLNLKHRMNVTQTKPTDEDKNITVPPNTQETF